MKSLNIQVAIEIAISSSIGIVGGAIANQYVISSTDWFYYLIAFFLVSISVLVIFNYFGSKIADKVSFLRGLSTNYIEGQWVQMIDDSSLTNLPPTKFSILEIKMQDGQLKVTGRSYNQNDGFQTTNFHSLFSKFDADTKKLSYVYTFTTDEEHSKNRLFGETELIFSKYGTAKKLNKYMGRVHSNLRDNVRVLAIKIDKEQNYNFSNTTSREKVISSISEAFQC